MRIQEVTLEYIVKDVSNTIIFYQTLLGFELLASEADNGKMSWALMQKGNFKLSFKSAKKIREEAEYFKSLQIGGTTNLVLKVENLHLAYEKIKTKCELLNHPHLTPCGQTEFSLKDVNGYFITFEQPMKVASKAAPSLS